MALKGTLKDFGIADILQLIGQQQKTGTLHLAAREQEVNVIFKDGSIAGAESSTRKRKDLIGAMLVQAELISPQQLESALETQKRTLTRLGEVLVTSGMLSRDRFVHMVNLQTQETLYRLFTWKTGTYEFVQGEVSVEGSDVRPLRAESVLMEGFRRVDEWPVIKKTIPSYELTFDRVRELPPPPVEQDAFDAALDEAISDDPPKGSEFKGLGPNERRVYELCLAGRDVRKITELSCLGEFESCKALLNLVNLGYLKVIAPSGKASALGDPETLATRLGGVVGRVAITTITLLVLGLLALRMNLQSFTFSGSAAAYEDLGAQRLVSKAQLSRIEAAIGVYRLEKGALPESLDQLVAARLLGEEDLRHPWRDRYYYRRTDQGSFVLLPPLR